jgi:hypothetical protein
LKYAHMNLIRLWTRRQARKELRLRRRLPLSHRQHACRKKVLLWYGHSA